MELTVLVNPSQSEGESAQGHIVATNQGPTIVVDSNRPWIASRAEERWATGAVDRVFLRALDVSDSVILQEFVKEIARAENSIHFFVSERDEKVVREALHSHPEVTVAFSRFGSDPASTSVPPAAHAPVISPSKVSWQKTLGLLLIHIEAYDITRECLSSLEATTYENKKIFVLENASANFSALRLFLEFPSVVFLFGTARISYCASFNLLADFAIRRGSEYLFVSNNDTRGHSPNIFEALTSGIAGNIGMVSPKVYDFDHVLLRSGVVNHFGVDFSLATEAYVISAELWQQVDGFANSFNIYGEDVDLLLRVRALGKEGRYEESVEMEHLQNGVTGNKVFIRTFFYMRNIVWLQKRRNVRVAYDIAYYSAQESIQLFLWAWRLALKRDVYPFFSVIVLVPTGILAGIVTRPHRNEDSDLSEALRRSTWELKFKVR
jgi:GT2 family glycosyltransferase